MSDELPVGWVLTRIQDLVQRLEYGYTAKAEHRSDGPRFLRITDIENGRIDWAHVPRCEIDGKGLSKYRLEHGDIVFARTGSIEKACMVRNPPEAAFASYLIRARPIEARTAIWLNAFVSSFEYRTQAAAASAGIGRSNINAKSIGRIRLRLPPLPEQRRIVEALESYFTRLDDAVATLERVQRNLKRYRASVLKAAVEGRLVPTEAELARAEGRDYEPASVLLERILAERRRRWEEAELAKMEAKGKVPKDDGWKGKYTEPVAPDTTELPELPEGWCWASIEQLSDRITKGTTPTSLGFDYVDAGEVRFVRVESLRDRHIDHAVPSAFIDQTTHRALARSQLRSGDLLYSIAGTLGRIGLVSEFDTPANTNQALAIIRGATEYVLDRFILCVLESDYGQRLVLERGRGGAMQNLSLADVGSIPVPLAPTSEQERVALAADRALSLGADVDGNVRATIVRCTRERQSILKWAFEGRLVAQDPTDEPASALLERIQAEREATAPAKKSSAPRRRRKERTA